MAKLKDTTIVGGGSDKTLQIVNPQLQEVITIDMLNKVYNIGGFINKSNDETFFVPLKLEA